MKFFNWVQNKLNAGQANKKPNAAAAAAVPPASTSSSQGKVRLEEDPPKEKFNDWSNGLLTIGTFGNRDHKEDNEIQRAQVTGSPENGSGGDEIQGSISPYLAEFTPEEVGHLQKELTKLLKKKHYHPPQQERDQKNRDLCIINSNNNNEQLPLDRFLNCPSSLDVDRTNSSRYSIYSDQYRDNPDEEDIDRTIRAIIGRCKQVSMESKNKAIGKKSLSFLLKKMFVCTSGFVPTPSLRDTLQESRMEKLLRTLLSKKIYPQNGSRASSTKRFLVDSRPKSKAQKDDEEIQEKQADRSCKWVKNDSEYIVLDLD